MGHTHQNQTEANCMHDVHLEAVFGTVVTAVALFSVILNSVLLFVMLKTKKIRENSVNSFIFAITAANILTSLEFILYKQYLLKVSDHAQVGSKTF
jgi:hypothetical protein